MKKGYKILSVLSLALLLTGCNSTPTSSSISLTTSDKVTTSETTSDTTSEKPSVTSSEEVTTSEVTSNTTSEESSATSSVEDTNKQLHLSFEEEAAGDITETKTLGDFKLIGTSDKKLTIAESQATVGETVYTKGIKTNGGASTTSGKEYRVIEFTTTGAGTVKIAAKSGSSDDATRSISILNKDKGFEEDTKTIAVEPAIYEFTIHSAGTFLISCSNGLWYYDIEVNYVVGTGDDNWTPSIEIENSNILSPSEIGGITMESSTTFGNFTILAGEGTDHNVVIDSNSKKCNGKSFTHRLKLGGTGSRDERCIKFSLTGPTIIELYAMSGKSSENRPLDLVKLGATAEEDTVVETVTTDGASISCFTLEVVEAGDYAIWSTKSGVNIYYIELIAAE